MMIYNVSVTVAVLCIAAGVWMNSGLAYGVITFGGLVLARLGYSGERLR